MENLSASNELRGSTVDSLGDPRRATRMICLVLANVALVASPVLATSLSMLGISSFELFGWVSSAVYGLNHPPLMLLVVWCGLGTSRPPVRILGGMAGVSYYAATHVVLSWQLVLLITGGSLYPEPTAMHWRTFVDSILLIGALSAFWLIPLFIYRAKWGTLRLTNGVDDSPASKPQIRLGSLFISTLILALYLGLGRFTRSSSQHEDFDFRGVAQQALYLLTFGLVGYWGLRAALAPGRLESRNLLAFLFGVVLVGNLYATCVSWSPFDWSDVGNLLFWTAYTVGLPAVIYLASLLVLRSCGYRLVPHEMSRSIGA